MCIISGPVKGVSNTQIFVGTNKDRTRQVTVYGNKVDNVSKGNAMILPVPFPASVTLIDLSKYTDIFTDCQRDFYNTMKSLSFSRSYNGIATDSLQVFDVGSYSISIAHNLQDLKRVDASVFLLHRECADVLAKHYPEHHWGFLICKLKNGNHKYHPLAYSHTILNNKFFIPTLHHHAESSKPHMVGPIMGINTRGGTGLMDFSMFEKDEKQHTEGDWDHTIYVHNGLKSSYNGAYEWSGECHVNKQLLQFPLSKARYFERIDIEGQHSNIDIYVPVRPPHSAPAPAPASSKVHSTSTLTSQEQMLIKKLFPHLSRTDYETLYGHDIRS